MSEAMKERSGTSLRRFKPYPAYRDSGVDWLGEIPAHWEVMRLGFNADFIVPMRDKPADLTGETPWIRIEDFGGRYISGSKSGQGVSDRTIREMNLKVFPARTVLCSCSCNMGATAIVEKPLISNQTFIGIVPGKNLVSEYVYYLMQVAKEHLTALATGAIQQYLSRNEFSSLRMPLLPIEEQRGIAAFLDRETAKIDALVAKKERLIELLQEKRTVLITRAVTKGLPAAAAAQAGLDPNVPMKDSGVEWLGEIPAHWQCVPLRRSVLSRAGAIKTGPFGSQLLASEMQGGDVKVYNQRNVIDRDFANGENFVSREKFKELSAFAVCKGDVLVTTRGTIGRCAIVPEDAEEGILHPCLMRIQPDPKQLLRSYLALLIQDSILVQTQLALASNATTIDVIYSDTMGRILVPKPPLEEQAAIVGWVGQRTCEVDSLIKKVSDASDRLKELRTALISAAVTGKIDVREEVV